MLLFRLAPLAVVLVAAACPVPPPAAGTDAGPVAVDRPDGGGAEGCTVDDDCPFGLACEDGACVAAAALPVDDGCRNDDECDLGFVCAASTGACVVEPSTPPPVVGPPGACVTDDVRSCGRKVGACTYGVERCVEGAWSGTCDGGVAPADEECNGVDDDCDGSTDEDFVVGDDCSEGTGACRVQGATVCSPDGLAAVCDATPLPAQGRTELCGNDVDDDCDGATDEGFDTLGEACAAGVGACRRDGVLLCSADLVSLRCSASPATPGDAELCGNTIDDDCDGSTDEGFGALGGGCSVGNGACAAPGSLVCADDGLALSCEPLPAAGEQCNGIDDDNDGCVDDGFDVGASCTVGVGVCRAAGVKQCAAGGLATSCVGTPGAPNAAGELCGNGLDDDCDGGVDEAGAFPTLGQACTAGLGVCARTGALVCAADGRGVVCDATAGLPAASGELCGNGLDDDCDGSVDEGFDVGATCTNGTGVCVRSGAKKCSADRRTTVCDAVPATPTVRDDLCANGLDDDCDGFIDEGFATLGEACAVGTGACRRTGTFTCSADLTTTTCGATAGAPAPERCDDIDNDCNGDPDNGCDDDGDDFCDAALAFSGSTTCPRSTATSLDCDDGNATVNPGAAEVCGDTRDQNCDGNASDGCAACSRTVDADFDGSNQCDDCDDTQGSVKPGATERCDGVDNDCDDAIDEGFDTDGDGFTTCGTLPEGGLATARIDCDDANRNRFPGGCELCALGAPSNTVACGTTNDRGNGVDEDCDGFIDETCSPCSTADPDGDGFSQCQGDCAPNDGTVRPGLAEACDGKDNDCNKFTTQNCEVSDPCGFADATTDVCQDRLICAASITAGGRTGPSTCTSLCNQTPLGAGLGDGCADGQTCAFQITPSVNLHGCAVNAAVGTKAVGTDCRADDECVTGRCFNDTRFAGNVKYCSDLCSNDDACGNGTNCQAIAGTGTALCRRSSSTQTLNYQDVCTTTSASRCKDGTPMCIDVVQGGACQATDTNCRCSDVCCTDSDCAAGSYCSTLGSFVAGQLGGIDSQPACLPHTSGNGGRPAGAACGSNNDCASEFCDRHTGVCFDVCCHDATCPGGQLCESVLINKNPDADTNDCTAGSTDTDDQCTFARMCIGLSPARALERR
jgi:hypothetical protein